MTPPSCIGRGRRYPIRRGLSVRVAPPTDWANESPKFAKRAYLLLAAMAVVGAIPMGLAGILAPHYRPSLGFLFGASVLLSMVLGPCNTVTANVVPANRRAAAYAAFIFLIHLFGDISSPIILGWISDFFGKPSVAGSPIGQFCAALGAAPVGETNLTLAMLSVAPVLVLGCIFFLLGARHLPSDQEKVRTGGEKDAVRDPYFH